MVCWWAHGDLDRARAACCAGCVGCSGVGGAWGGRVAAAAVITEEVAAQDGSDGAEILRCGVRAQPWDVVSGCCEVRVDVQVQRGGVGEAEEVRGVEGVGCCCEKGE